jgi:hypothetical protein
MLQHENELKADQVKVRKYNFETNDSDINFILLQRRFDASCIIFKVKIRIIRV